MYGSTCEILLVSSLNYIEYYSWLSFADTDLGSWKSFKTCKEGKFTTIIFMAASYYEKNDFSSEQ
jgi:hypothetical protein